jgi:predicted XRE-type DNA-binding protein
VRRTNVFEQVGFSREEAKALAIKTDLLTEIVKYAKKNYSQADLQKLLDESQPRISDLLRGKIANFSLEKLVEYAIALNMRPEIRTHKPIEMMPERQAVAAG